MPLNRLRILSCQKKHRSSQEIHCWCTSIFQAYYHTHDLKFSLILQIIIIIGSILCCLTSVCLLIDLHLAKFQPQPSVRKQKQRNGEKWGETEGNRKKEHKANTIQLQRIAQRFENIRVRTLIHPDFQHRAECQERWTNLVTWQSMNASWDA